MPGRSLGRLRKGAEFDSAYSEGSVVNGPLFVVRARSNHIGRSRWGFAVGKKLLPKATRRNLMRRKLREAARASGGIGGYDIIVVAKAGALRAQFRELEASLARQISVVVEAKDKK